MLTLTSILRKYSLKHFCFGFPFHSQWLALGVTDSSPSPSLSLLCFLSPHDSSSLLPLVSSKTVCSLSVPSLPPQASLGALDLYQQASSRKRRAPTEPVIFTLFCWSGPLFWFRSGSTSGSCNCCPSLWLVTHTHANIYEYTIFFKNPPW